MEFLTELLAFVQGGEFAAWIDALTKFVAGATAITIITPTKVDNVIVDTVLKVLNVAAGNFGFNKNSDDK